MIEYTLDLFNQCEHCNAYCCNGDGPVFLTDNEMKQLGCNKALNTPCKYLNKNKCSIYNERPQMCRDYPLEVSDKLIIIKDIYYCPSATLMYEKLLDFLEIYYPNKLPDLSEVNNNETEMCAIPVVLYRGFVNWLKNKDVCIENV